MEYNQLEGLLGKGVKETLVPGTNFSTLPGNINVLIMDASLYLGVLHAKKGAIAEFVNPKYNADKQSFKKPTRLECMMQDYPKLLGSGQKVGFTQFARWCSFSAVKNALADGADKQKAGNAPEVASTGEQDMYAYSATILQSVGAHLESSKDEVYGGVKVNFPAKVIFEPSVGTTTAELREKLTGKDKIKISARSTLVVDGDQVSVGALQLDGALIVHAVSGARVRVDGLTVSNGGWRFRALSAEELTQVDQKYAMRGYVLERQEQAYFLFDKPGEYVLSDANAKQFATEYKHPARRPQ